MVEYLEISGRQSGKTTRLIEKARGLSRRGENCYIFTVNNQMKRLLQNQIGSKQIKACSSNNFLHNSQLVHEINSREKKYLFFDEFDFYVDESKEVISHLCSNSSLRLYFATTPSYQRSLREIKKHYDNEDHHFDLLIQLIEMMNFKYETFLNEDMVKNNSKSLLGDEQKRVEVYASVF